MTVAEMTAAWTNGEVWSNEKFIAGDAFRWPGTDKQERHSEPLYRLKVSNG